MGCDPGLTKGLPLKCATGFRLHSSGGRHEHTQHRPGSTCHGRQSRDRALLRKLEQMRGALLRVTHYRMTNPGVFS